MNSVIRAVREKYPEYQDVSDADLTMAIGQKYPEYLDVPDFESDFRLQGARRSTIGIVPGAAETIAANEPSADLGPLPPQITAPGTSPEDVTRGVAMHRAQLSQAAREQNRVEGYPSNASRPVELGLDVGPAIPIPEITEAHLQTLGMDAAPYKVAAGLVNAANGVINFLQSPEGILLMTTGKLPGGLQYGKVPSGIRAATFSAMTGQMLADEPKLIQGAFDAIQKGDTVSATSNIAMALAMPKAIKYTGMEVIGKADLPTQTLIEAVNDVIDRTQIHQVFDTKPPINPNFRIVSEAPNIGPVEARELNIEVPKPERPGFNYPQGTRIRPDIRYQAAGDPRWTEIPAEEPQPMPEERTPKGPTPGFLQTAEERALRNLAPQTARALAETVKQPEVTSLVTEPPTTETPKGGVIHAEEEGRKEVLTPTPGEPKPPVPPEPAPPPPTATAEPENAWMEPALGKYQYLGNKDIQIIVTPDNVDPSMVKATYLKKGEPNGHQLFRTLSDLKQATSNTVKVPNDWNGSVVGIPLEDAIKIGKAFGQTEKAIRANWEHFNKPTPTAKAKEPWEMTKAEWMQWADPSVTITPEFHEALVKDALQRGEPVPEAVLKDYPDLAPQEPKGGAETAPQGKGEPESVKLQKEYFKAEEDFKSAQEKLLRTAKRYEEWNAERSGGRPGSVVQKALKSTRVSRDIKDAYYSAKTYRDRMMRETENAMASERDIAQDEITNRISEGKPVTQAELKEYFQPDSEWVKMAKDKGIIQEQSAQAAKENILARGEERDNPASDTGATIRTEWRIRKVSPEQFYDEIKSSDERSRLDPKNTYVVEQRRVDTDQGKESFGKWDYPVYAKGRQGAIAEAMGATDFRKAMSNDPTHALEKLRLDTLAKLAKEKEELEKQITAPDRWSKSPIDEEYNNRYLAELKKAKLYSKAGKGQADPNKIEAIQAPLREERMERLRKIKDRIEEIYKEQQQVGKPSWKPSEPPAAPPAAQAKAKEPWEMTRAEFFKWKKNQPIDRQARMEAQTGSPVGITGGKRLMRAGPQLDSLIHKGFIEQAITEGKPVPPEVLADYPDLAQKEKGEATPAKEVPMVGDEVTWTTGAGDKAISTVVRIFQNPNDLEPMADVDWFGMKTVPVSKLELRKKSSRREWNERRAAQQAKGGIHIRPGEGKQGEAGFLYLPKPEDLPLPVLRFARRLNSIRRGIVWRFQNANPLEVMAYKKDEARNAAMLYAQAHGNEVEHELYRTAGVALKPSWVRRTFTPWTDGRELMKAGLSAIVESGRDPMELARMRDTLVNAPIPPHLRGSDLIYWKKWKDLEIAAIDYATQNFAQLDSTAQMYEAATLAQAQVEEANGIETPIRQRYVMHAQDVEGMTDLGLFERQTGGEGSVRFRKMRDYNTFADSIAAGIVPISLDGIALLKKRLSLGQQAINNRLWLEQLKTMEDAAGNPLIKSMQSRSATKPVTKWNTITSGPFAGRRVPVADPGWQIRYQDINGVRTPVNYRMQLDPPPGYSSMEYAGQRIAIRDGFDQYFQLLTDPSAVAKSPGARGFMEAAALGKHALLLFDTFHLGRLAAWSAIVQRNLPHYRRSLLLMENTVPELQKMAAHGEIPQRYLRDLIQDKQLMDLAVKEGYNVGGVEDNLYTHVLQALPMFGAFNKFLFEKFQRGAMMSAWLHEYRRQRGSFQNLSDAEVARKVSKELNTRFGTLHNQSWIKSKTLRDLSRFLFLAPGWNEGLIRSEIGAVAQFLKAPVDSIRNRRIATGALLNAVGSLVVAQFVANQLINMVTRGHPTWQNPEDGWESKISAFIPDLTGSSPGYLLNPITLPFETVHLIVKGMERTDSLNDSVRQYVRSRLGAATRPMLTWLTKHDVFDRPIAPEEFWREFAISSVPLPISAGAVTRFAGEVAANVTGSREQQQFGSSQEFPGQYQKQALASMGMKTQTLPTPEARTRKLADAWKKANGVQEQAEFYTGDYSKLNGYLRLNNFAKAKEAMAELLKKKTVPAVIKHFNRYPRIPFTGNRSREMQFYDSLTEAQKKDYDAAIEKRYELIDKAFGILNEVDK